LNGVLTAERGGLDDESCVQKVKLAITTWTIISFGDLYMIEVSFPDFDIDYITIDIDGTASIFIASTD